MHTIYAIVSLATDGERRQWDRLMPRKALTKEVPNFNESAIAAGVFSFCRARLGIQCPLSAPGKLCWPRRRFEYQYLKPSSRVGMGDAFVEAGRMR